MSRLEKCPCGERPGELSVSDAGQGGKWAWVTGGCCGVWEIEFRNNYAALESDACMESAVDAWNDAPRDGQ